MKDRKIRVMSQPSEVRRSLTDKFQSLFVCAAVCGVSDY